MKKTSFKTISLEEITDKHIGKRGTKKREAFEQELRIDLLKEGKKQTPNQRKNVFTECNEKKIAI